MRSLSSSSDQQRLRAAVRWLEQECPEELFARVLAFAGPREVSSFVKIDSQPWKQMMQSETVWHVLCHDLHKWQPGDPEPKSWREHYQTNLCVPSEFATLQEALEASQQAPAIRILVQPGIHRVDNGIVVNNSGSLTIETLQVPLHEEPSQGIPKFHHASMPYCGGQKTVATLAMENTRQNLPMFHVQQGTLLLKNIKLEHSCYGNEFLDGNAAIHIEPSSLRCHFRTTKDFLPAATSFSVDHLPSLSLQSVEITSHSGQGIMNNRGGNVRIHDCYIHDCAATGLYVDAPQSDVLVQQSDIMANGHAGVHLEFGTGARVLNCGIVGNSSIGVSVHDTLLSLECSDVVANGYQLELERPPKRLQKNNIHALLMMEQQQQLAAHSHPKNDYGRSIITRTPMAQRNFVHHMSKFTLLMDNHRRRGTI
ncbi:expressed unknown protein [Seminavis robusta]|uniref:Right handed beta helix domain-containing protein n=1 Tax=Seminavis robusta TaxID=568900 RepID=A0A9N8E0P5_9STRA|nr:expressed unknown protein [Seminavis robusta]|eukprot:Sro529_g161020.1 n/a (424) ;mRNA; r:26094-27480